MSYYTPKHSISCYFTWSCLASPVNSNKTYLTWQWMRYLYYSPSINCNLIGQCCTSKSLIFMHKHLFYTGTLIFMWEWQPWKQRLWRIYDKYSGFAVFSATIGYMGYFKQPGETRRATTTRRRQTKILNSPFSHVDQRVVFFVALLL